MNFPEYIQTYKHNNVVNVDTLRQITIASPKIFVDVGAGDGFYGKLIKYYDVSIQSYAVEKTEKYIEMFKLHDIYDIVYMDDIKNLINTLKGDLIIFGDVLEHLEKEQSNYVLNKSIENFKYIIVNSPVGFQAHLHENINEIHRCGLCEDDFKYYNVIEYNTYCNGAMFNCFVKGNWRDK